MTNPNLENQQPKRPEVELFTEAEHVVLASYLECKPLCETDLSLCDALEELEIPEEIDHAIFTSEDAAVASIVLRNAQKKLPQFVAVDPNSPATDPLIERVKLARDIRPDPAQRKVKLFPQHLFTINWAASGPGFSWPEAYYATWIPGYEVAILTQSGDCPEAYGGFCDLAIGWAGAEDDLATCGASYAAGVWGCLVGEAEQERWEHFDQEGIVSRAQAEAEADKVWGPWEQ